MSSAIARRLAISDPHPPSLSNNASSDFLIATLAHGSTDIKLYTYHETANQTRLKAMLTDVVGGVGAANSYVRSIAWSPSPTHSTLLACGTGSGQIILHDLQPLLISSSTSQPHSHSIQSGPSIMTPQTRLSVLSGRHNRACTSIVWSKHQGNWLWAGYDKTRNEYSLALWDVEIGITKPTTTTTTTTGAGHSSNQPIQSYLPSETVTSIETLNRHPSTILVSTAGRMIRLIDFRTPTTTAGGTGGGQPQGSIIWQTKAAHGLSASNHLFAGYEEGLSGIVKIFDIRFPLSSSGAATPLASQPGGSGSSNGEVGSYFAGGSVTGIGWRLKQEGGVETLAVGVREGGVNVLDVVSMMGTRGEEGMDSEIEEMGWSGFVGCKRTGKNSFPLSDFAFLPSERKNRTSLLSVFRDGSYSIEHLTPHTKFTDKPLDGIVCTPDNEIPQRVLSPLDNDTAPPPLPIYGISPRHSVDNPETSFNSEDITLLMREKAVLGFGLELSVNDAIEARYPTNGGFLFLWLERFFNLMGRRSISKISELDFTLQGLVSIWNGLENPNRDTKTQTRRGFDTAVKSQSASSRVASRAGIRSGSGYRSSGHSSTRGLRDTVDQDYLSALATIMEGREAEFVSTGVQAVTDRPHHRKLMLGICGELAGEKLNTEIHRIAESQITKAACLALFNGQEKRAIKILKASSDEKHRLMASLIRMGHIEPDVIELSDPYLGALVHFLQGNRAWDSVLRDESLPLLERLVLALRFVDDDTLPIFLERQMRSCIDRGDLQGLPLTGLVRSRETLELLQNYLNRTYDIQTVAIISTLIYGKHDGKIAHWNQEYRSLLDRWRLFMERVDYDMARGSIARQQGNDIERPIRTVIRCHFCQKSISAEGAAGYKTTQSVRTDRCPNCQNTWPKCCVCLLPMNGPDKTRLGEAYGGGALVFCQTCHHGGHQSHILAWFYGPPQNETHPSHDLASRDRVESAAHDVCAVADCNCRCADL